MITIRETPHSCSETNCSLGSWCSSRGISVACETGFYGFCGNSVYLIWLSKSVCSRNFTPGSAERSVAVEGLD